jgi:predicted dehydrogenase
MNLSNTLPESRMIPSIGVIGLGSHSRSIIIPILKKEGKIVGIASNRNINEAFIDPDNDFSFGTRDPLRLIKNESVNTIFIITRHNLHASQLTDSLREGRHTFVERPLCLSFKELEEITLVYASLKLPKPHLMVGFNLRFAPAIKKAMQYLTADSPKTVNINLSCNLPENHWINDPEVGGGPIVGNLCQYIDLALFLSDSKVISLNSQLTNSAVKTERRISIAMQFANDSKATISNSSGVDGMPSRVAIELKCGETEIHIVNFQSLEMATAGKKTKFRFEKDEMGYKSEIQSFLSTLREGIQSPIPFNDLIYSTRISLLASDSYREKREIRMRE